MSPDLYVVLHVPKTAGSTLRANFKGNFKSHEWLSLPVSIADRQRSTVMGAIDEEIAKQPRHLTRCAFGHWAYIGIHQKIRPDARPRYITFLREPVARCVSLYGYIKTRPGNQHYQIIKDNDWSLGEWLEKGNVFELFNGQLRRLLFDGSDDILIEPHLTREHLEAAKARLREFWFVGLTETFDEDSLYLYGKLKFWRLYHTRAVNVTLNKPVASPSEDAALREANALDIELYRYACELRADWRRQHARDIRTQERRARMFQQIYVKLSRMKQVAKGSSKSP
jgi:hypothetical protein